MCGDPLSVLVAVILSQNTNDVNSTRAFRSLIQKTGCPLKPEAILSMDAGKLAETIKVSGMQHTKAKTIISLVKSVSTEELEESNPLELRAKLLRVPGIGYKTADVFLLMYRRFPVFPIDTHIRRVLVRYGAVGPKDDYETIRTTVEAATPRDVDYLIRSHLSLIKHGRTTCGARKPLCDECPVSSSCAKVSVPR